MGYCEKHYLLWRRASPVNAAPPAKFTCAPAEVNGEDAAACQVRECARPHHHQGWCRPHYLKWRRGLSAALLANNRICEAEGCMRRIRCKHMCAFHYQYARKERLRANSETVAADVVPMWETTPTDVPDAQQILGVMALRGRMSIRSIARKIAVTEGAVRRIFEEHEHDEPLDRVEFAGAG